MANNHNDTASLVSSRLTLLGGGHLAQALVSGIVAQSRWKEQCNISITARRPEHVQDLKEMFPNIYVTLDNLDNAIWTPARENRDGSHTLIICTRPADTPGVIAQIASILATMCTDVRPTVVTMCPGIAIEQLEHWLPKGTAIIRSMPNTPVACCQGATALYPNHEGLSRVNQVKTVLQDVSPRLCVLPKESLLDVAAAVAGSAPAYFYYIIEALVAAGEANGLESDVARALVTQSCLGAGMLARDADRPTVTLRKEVCVPGGSTEKGIAYMERFNVQEVVQKAVGKSLQANRAMRNVGNLPNQA